MFDLRRWIQKPPQGRFISQWNLQTYSLGGVYAEEHEEGKNMISQSIRTEYVWGRWKFGRVRNAGLAPVRCNFPVTPPGAKVSKFTLPTFL